MEAIDKKLEKIINIDNKNINDNINEKINKNINVNEKINNISVNNIQHKSKKTIYKFEDYFIFWN
jgi:hypothetical protein